MSSVASPERVTWSRTYRKLKIDRAKEFASLGCKVYATARNIERMQALRHLPVELLSLDVTDDSAIKVVINNIIANEGKIDIVVNNAGVGCYGA